ncbi:hypothetical protein [Streptomyces monomycini]|uniref:hypothetical protein n=1 Tax=Streptomyces monomycini TaxID=371720 RepID=UPI00067E2F01|nr:hypothetical protein [Streptomyces monomycini]
MSATNGQHDSDEKCTQAAPDLADESDIDWERVLVEELDGLREEERIEREAEQELRTVLDSLGPQNLDKRLTEVDDQQPAWDTDRQREAAHRQVGARQAAAASRIC